MVPLTSLVVCIPMAPVDKLEVSTAAVAAAFRPQDMVPMPMEAMEENLAAAAALERATVQTGEMVEILAAVAAWRNRLAVAVWREPAGGAVVAAAVAPAS